jgi:hypothetical protein
MASPVPEDVTESSTPTASTSHIVNMPATRPDGQLYIHIGATGSTAATWTQTGWTELLDEGLANSLTIAYRLGSSEPASYTFTTSAVTRSADMVYRISGAENPATIPPAIGTTATATSTTPDPPSITPPSSKDYLFIACFAMAGEQADDNTLVTTFPTNYTVGQAEKTCGVAGTNLGGMLGAAARQLTTGAAENPGTFTAIANALWRAQTIIVHPAPPPLPGPVRTFVLFGPAMRRGSWW